jgi:deoxycytidylate deaminase
MKGHQLIVNKTIVKAFDTFNSEYALKAISICNILSKFQIIAVDYNDSLYVDKIDLKDYEAFGFYINKVGIEPSSTYAEIIVNERVCERMGLSEQEMIAAIAHEVGHIIFYFKTNKEDFQGQAEEVSCDTYACRMGLAIPLCSLLEKQIYTGDYQMELVNQMKNRLFYIKEFSD